MSLWRSQTTVLTAGASTHLVRSLAMILASVLKGAVVFCSQLVQDTVPSANTAVTPVVELIVVLSSATSASLKTFNSSEL